MIRFVVAAVFILSFASACVDSLRVNDENTRGEITAAHSPANKLEDRAEGCSPQCAFPRYPARVEGAPDWGLSSDEMIEFIHQHFGVFEFENIGVCGEPYNTNPNCFKVTVVSLYTLAATRMNGEFKLGLLRELERQGVLKIISEERIGSHTGIVSIFLKEGECASDECSDVFERHDGGFRLRLFQAPEILEIDEIQPQDRRAMRVTSSCNAASSLVPINMSVKPINNFARELLGNKTSFQGYMCFLTSEPSGIAPSPLDYLELK